MFDAFDEELDFADDQLIGLGVSKPNEERRLTPTGNSPVASVTSIPIVERSSLFRNCDRSSTSGFVGASSLSARLIGTTRKPASTEQSQIILDNFLQGEIEDGSSSSSLIEDAGDEEDFNDLDALRARSVSPFRKRLFPGPAGILQTKSLDLNDDISHRRHPSSKRGRWQSTPADCENFKAGFTNICSQSAANEVFESDLWTEMKLDLAGQVNEYGGLDILERFNIAHLLKTAKMNRLPNRKASSLLCVVLQFIDYRCLGKYARAMFRDPSGEILGWFGGEIVKEYRSKLKPGCVLVLKKPSMFSLSRRKHYLSVHLSNVMRIYVTNDDGTVKCIEPCRPDVQASSPRTGSTSSISSDSGSSRIANVAAIDNENVDSVVTPESVLARANVVTGSGQPQNDHQIGNVVNRPRLSLIAGCQKEGESTAAAATDVVTDKGINVPRNDVSKSKFQLEDDPFWNDDDFDRLLLSIGH